MYTCKGLYCAECIFLQVSRMIKQWHFEIWHFEISKFGINEFIISLHGQII